MPDRLDFFSLLLTHQAGSCYKKWESRKELEVSKTYFLIAWNDFSLNMHCLFENIYLNLLTLDNIYRKYPFKLFIDI